MRDDDLVLYTDMGHLKEIQHMSKMNTKSHIRKINKDEYVLLETGEIKEYEHINNRSESKNSLFQTFKKLRYYINNNFYGKRNELFITLTYKKNMKDRQKLMVDVEKFIKRLRYRFKGKTSIDYLNIVEPQARGAWHCHILMKFNELDSIYIPNEELRRVWGHGFVRVNRLNDVDNIGAYLSAYLTDLELTDETKMIAVERKAEIVEKTVGGKEKKFIKGGRLHLYPPGMKIFRKSEGIKYPERKKMRLDKAKKCVGSAKPTHYAEKEINIDDDSIHITFYEYNLKRL